jgi:hypothetical protein
MTTDDKDLVERLRKLLEHATPLPWAWEQCGEKEDCPVVGIILDNDEKPIAGFAEDFDEHGEERGFYRDTIALEWQSCDGCSPSANAALVVETINELPALLDRIEQLSSALTDARDAIASLPEDGLGMAQIPFGTTGVDMYPIRDELLATINSALQSLQVGGGE